MLGLRIREHVEAILDLFGLNGGVVFLQEKIHATIMHENSDMRHAW